MRANIETTTDVSKNVPHLLGSIADDLRSAGIRSTVTTGPGLSRAKDGGIALALSIAGLTVSSLGTLLSILSFVKSRYPSLVVQARSADLEVEIEVFTPRKLKDTVQVIVANGDDAVNIVISSSD